MKNPLTPFIEIVSAIVGVAVIAVLVSKQQEEHLDFDAMERMDGEGGAIGQSIPDPPERITRTERVIKNTSAAFAGVLKAATGGNE